MVLLIKSYNPSKGIILRACPYRHQNKCEKLIEKYVK